MIYYEINAYSEMFSAIDAYKHMLKSEVSAPDREKERINNFLNFTLNLAKARIDNDKVKMGFLKDSIIKEYNLTNKDWLLSKTSELIE